MCALVGSLDWMEIHPNRLVYARFMGHHGWVGEGAQVGYEPRDRGMHLELLHREPEGGPATGESTRLIARNDSGVAPLREGALMDGRFRLETSYVEAVDDAEADEMMEAGPQQADDYSVRTLAHASESRRAEAAGSARLGSLVAQCGLRGSAPWLLPFSPSRA